MKIVATGGCINRQEGLPFEEHYHYLLRDKVYQCTGTSPDIRLLTYYNYFQVSSYIAEALHDRPDVLVFFLRPFPLHPLFKPVIRYQGKSAVTQTILHPVFRRSNLALQSDTMVLHATAPQQAGRLGHRILAHANIAAGKILRLDRWALHYIVTEIGRIHEICQRSGTRLILTGPPGYPAYAPLDQFCARLSEEVGQMSKLRGISHVDMQEPGRWLGPDGVHLSRAGHGLLADALASLLLPV